MNINQYKNENLLDYFKIFKKTRDVVKIQSETYFLDIFVTNQEE